MSTKTIADLPSSVTPASTDMFVIEDAGLTTRRLTMAQLQIFVSSIIANSNVAGGRLTLSATDPVTTSDVTGVSTLYYLPFDSARISIYDGTNWQIRLFTTVSVALAGLTSGKNYDVFAIWTGSVVALELSAAWASDTARTDALTRQNGLVVKSSDTTRRWLGTLRTTGVTTTEDSVSKRFVWNAYNQVPRPMSVVDATSSWTYNSATFHQANATATNKLQYVTGDISTRVEAVVAAPSTGSGNSSVVGIGIDSTSVDSSVTKISVDNSAVAVITQAQYKGYPGLGYHIVVWLESVNNSTGTFYGTNAARNNVSGIVGEILG